MSSGIYIILNKTNDKFYIGNSVNLSKRFYEHKRELKNNIHANQYLQHAWNKDGEENFMFIIIENVEKEFLLEREQFWIDSTDCCNRNIGYNLKDKVCNNKYKVKTTEETRKNLSESLKGIVKSNEWINNIKIAVLNSPKIFKNRRNFNKWPHEKGKRCNCKKCNKKKYLAKKIKVKFITRLTI